MAVLLLQLGDIHISGASDHILTRAHQIASAAAAEADSGVDACCILMTGDAVQAGTADEFVLAATFLMAIKTELDARLKCSTEIITIPGNHDLDLAADQEARNQIIDGIAAATMPAQSILDIVLAAQENYFRFANQASSPNCVLTLKEPFFRTLRVNTQGGTLDLYLINSAWISRRGEEPGSLFFPLETFVVDPPTPPAYSISVLHHPFNWFHQPTTMRPLRDKIEHSSDMIITGHEHGNAAYDKYASGTLGVLQYLEGGVLQERNDATISSFAVLLFDFQQQKQRIVRLVADASGTYVRQPGADDRALRVNLSRKDRRFQISTGFREFLDDPDLPLADSKQRSIRLLDIFTYPDLKEATGGTLERRWRWLKGDRVVKEILERQRVLVAGGPKAGKTSLSKSLFADMLSNGRLPLFIDGASLGDTSSDNAVRKALNKAIKEQYEKASVEEYEQFGADKAVLIIDNLHGIDDSRGGRERLLNFVDSRFGLVIAFADDEFVLEELHSRHGSGRKIVDYDRFHICEFGFIRAEELARRWLMSTRTIGSRQLEDDVKQICNVVQRVLQINAIPHHPWVLIVLLQEASSAQEIAVKNGSYGHLFQAIITSALYRSRRREIDIDSKYMYMAELAFAMYSKEVAVFDRAEAERFHNEHCDNYDLELNFNDVVDDLVMINILRDDSGRIAFRTKYSYWFFVAWHLSKHIHEDSAKAIVDRLCERLHHEDSANIFVFLAHLSNDPHVITSILRTARTLFSAVGLANLDDDIKSLNSLHPEEIRLKLPSTDPEENLRRLREAKDEENAQRDESLTDGRKVEPTATATNDGSGDDFKVFVRTVQAGMKTIDILGQVLRNGAGSISAAQKREIVDEIYRLARRVNGTILQDLPQQLPGWISALHRHYEVKYPNDDINRRVSRILNNISNSLWFVTYALARRVSHSLAHEMLRITFEKVLTGDSCLPNRIFDLSIKLDIARGLPANEAERLYADTIGNVLVRSVVRALIANYLYLYRVPASERQSICERLEIEFDEQTFDPSRKKVKGLLAGPHNRQDSDERKAARKRKKAERKRRKP